MRTYGHEVPPEYHDGAQLTVLDRHRVRCGDLLQGSVETLMGSEKADIVYSDPPWGLANVRFWRSQNSENKEEFDWPGFITRFCQAVAATTTPNAAVYIEMGHRFSDEVAEIMNHLGFKERTRWTRYYAGCTFEKPKGGFTCNVLFFQRRGAPDLPMPRSLDNTHGDEVVRRALEPYAGSDAIVLDPCSGLGTTAKLAIRAGLRFRGNELNPYRLWGTVETIKRTTRGMRGRSVV